MNILHINDPAFTDESWKAYYSLIKTMLRKFQTPMANIGWEPTKKRLLSLAEIDPNFYRFVIFDDQTAIGWADLTVQAPNTPEQNVSMRVESTFEDIPEEFEKIVANEFLKLLNKHKSKHAHLMATTLRISSIARHWFGKELNKLERFQLCREKANAELMKSWVESIPEKNSDLRIEFFSPVPDEHLVAHTNLFVKYIQEMPTEHETEKPFQMTVAEVKLDMEWRRKNNTHIYTYALFDTDNIMIGHSNAVITGADPSDIYQAMTGINSGYRGRGLSRWLKAMLFFKTGEDFPTNKTMTTDMRATNAPIQKVNSEIGYQLLCSGHEFEISEAGLSKFLNY